MIIQVNLPSDDVQFPARGVAGRVVSHDRPATYAVLVPVTSGDGGILVPRRNCGDYVRVSANGMTEEQTGTWTLTIDATQLEFGRDEYVGVVVVLVVEQLWAEYGTGIPAHICEKIASLLSQSGDLKIGDRLKQSFVSAADAPGKEARE